MHPDFAPRAPCGPGGDSFRRPSSTSVLAARTTTSSSAPRTEAAASSPAVPARPQSEPAGGADGRARTVPVLSNLPGSSPHETPAGSYSHASSNDRLLRRFVRLALDSPSAPELRTVFSRACSDAFAGTGPISSALSIPVSGACSEATSKTAVLITSEVWKAVDAMGSVVAEFLHRLHQLLKKEASASSISRAENDRRENAGDIAGEELTACRLDYFSLGRLLRPLVLARTGNISTPAAVQQFFCHEVTGILALAKESSPTKRLAKKARNRLRAHELITPIGHESWMARTAIVSPCAWQRLVSSENEKSLYRVSH